MVKGLIRNCFKLLKLADTKKIKIYYKKFTCETYFKITYDLLQAKLIKLIHNL